jgi:hypothetical protein
MNESCHVTTTWMVHDTCEWVTSHMNASCHIWMSRVTSMRHVHMWMSRVTHVNRPCHIHESCHIWTSHIAHIHQPCHVRLPLARYEWFPLLPPPSPLKRHHIRTILENSFFTMNASFRSQAPSLPWKPVVQPHRWYSLTHPLLLASFSWWSWTCPFERWPRRTKRQTLSTWHGHASRFKDNQKTRIMPTKPRWIQVFDCLNPKYCILYVFAEFELSIQNSELTMPGQPLIWKLLWKLLCPDTI